MPAAAPTPAPIPPPEPELILPKSTKGTVVLVQGTRVLRPGQALPAGDLDVYSDFGDGLVLAGKVHLEPGQALDLACDPATRTCTGAAPATTDSP